MKALVLFTLILISFSYSKDCITDNDMKELNRFNGNCNPANTYGFNRYIETEEGFRYCSDLIKKCECCAKKCEREYNYLKGAERERCEAYLELRRKLPEIEKQYRERAKQDSIKRETEKREKAKQDSIKQATTKEILTLIENKAEINLILSKCTEYSLKSTQLQECKDIQDSIKITKITALLKANKLEESLGECKQVNPNEKITDLCKNQLVDKVRKLPKNKINSIELAKIYYYCDNEDGDEDNCKAIAGYVFQNDGKMLLMEHISLGHTIMVQHTGHIGKCQLEPNSMQIPFLGYAKYLGRKTYTSLLGNQSVPNYQLLFCESGY